MAPAILHWRKRLRPVLNSIPCALPISVQSLPMTHELLEALRGTRPPLEPHHRAAMVLIGFLLLYLNLWLLHFIYAAKHYVLLALVALPVLVTGMVAARLIRVAVLSLSRSA